MVFTFVKACQVVFLEQKSPHSGNGSRRIKGTSEFPVPPPPETPPLSWIGGFVLFLGTGFFVKYSIDNDLISPEWRVTLTYLAAAGLLGAGLSRLRKKYPILSGTLTSTGILVLYLATCAGRMFYELPFFTTAIATVLLAATTAAAFILAVRLRFRIIAFLGIIGGFLTPVILSTGQDHTASLFLYMTILNAGLLAVVAATRWTGAGGAGLAAYTILLMGWFDEYGGPSHISRRRHPVHLHPAPVRGLRPLCRHTAG